MKGKEGRYVDREGDEREKFVGRASNSFISKTMCAARKRALVNALV